MVIIDFFDFLDQLIQSDVIEIFVITLGDVVIRMLRVFLTQHRENNVVGVKITGRFEVFVAVKFHAFTQRKRIGFAIRRDSPGFCQRRNRGIFDRIKINQTVIKHLRAGNE
ncbi:hypothetical protein D3C71_1927220 [compost metagenome]